MSTSVLEGIERLGMHIGECSLPGETRADGVFPAHPNGMQLSRDRFLLLYSTRSHRGVDDDRSAVYQLRADGWGGPVLAEGFVSRTRDDWDPLGEGIGHVRQHGHVSGFGVPKGALIGGQRVPHENHFAVMWRQVARTLDPQTGWLREHARRPELWEKTAAAWWRQFRLNDARTDLEWLTGAEKMTLSGHETDPQVLPGRADVAHVIKGFTPAVPMNEECDAWVDLNSAGKTGGARAGSSRSRAVLPGIYRFNHSAKRYEWTEAGALSAWGFYEASVARFGRRFVYLARASGTDGVSPERMGHYKNHVHYHLTSDPLEDTLDFQPALDQPSSGPRTLFGGPDGRPWKLGGSLADSPYREERNPFYMMEIDPENEFRSGESHLIHDGEADNPGIPLPVWLDFPKLLPHVGGREQWILYRVRGIGLRYNPDTLQRALERHAQRESRPGVPFVRPLTEEEFLRSGIYAAKVRYRENQPAAWEFA